MIRNFLNSIKNNSLFFKMFLVMVVSIVAVSVLITYTMIRMSERLFIDTFSIANAKVMDQVTTDFEAFSYSLVSVANQVQQSGYVQNYLTSEQSEPIELAKATHRIKLQMDRYLTMINQEGINIVLLGENGRLYSTNYVNWPVSADKLKKDRITLNSYKDPNRILYQYDPKKIDHDINREETIVVSKALVDKSTDHIYGVIYIAIREQDFKQLYARYTGNGNNVLLLNQSGMVVSSSDESIAGQKFHDLLQDVEKMDEYKDHYKQVEVLGENRLLFSTYLPTLDMFLVNLIDRETVTSNLLNSKMIALISAIIVFLALCIVFIISRRLTKSLSSLVRQISNMSQKNFDSYVNESGSYETRQLAKAFNDMLDELHEYVEKLIDTQKKQRNAELEALQQQINPHFLYNTLASVKFMVQNGDREKSAQTINALISLLQNTIGNISETNTVEQELDNVKSYVYINQIRYGDLIKVHYFVSPECLQLELPKLILQPFIENAFFHGFNRKKEGIIQLMILQRDDLLICEINDNGDGMEDKTLDRKSKRQLFSGIGIRNVQERIQLIYGEQYGVDVSSQLGEGTRITIRLPVIKSKENTNL
ncbi:sensor histidine kinase [Bacillus sp. FJAT-49711]|uniref:sensor histidine kinase n=1 Tax=Bacillus sp. FJAT-49711 TaxID=2833585 RepID=UPI001BCA51C3|nr:sensor histidine kinase [Bacillus sp. FJAT-49711]MBS4220704.1 sensor histidine kinase [Bacillus sp. FJAT-49711]